MADIDAILKDPLNLIVLSERDEKALRYFQRTRSPALSEDKASELFQLYLRGFDCEDLRRANPGIGLGAIVHARVVWRWDLGIEEYRQKVRSGIVDRVATTSLESVDVITLLLSANNRNMREKLIKYMQSGNPADLPIEISSVREYKGLVETLQLLTGTKPTKHEHEHTHRTETPDPVGVEATAAPEHSEVLALLAGESPGPKTLRERMAEDEPKTLRERMAEDDRTAPLLEVPGVAQAVQEAQSAVEEVAKGLSDKVISATGLKDRRRKN